MKEESYNPYYSDTMTGESHTNSIPNMTSHNARSTGEYMNYSQYANMHINSTSNCTISPHPTSNNTHANYLPYSPPPPQINPNLSHHLSSTASYHTSHPIMRPPSHNLPPPSIHSNVPIPMMRGISPTPINYMPTSGHHPGNLPPLSHPSQFACMNPNQPILEARDHDVLCGRGVNISHHPGNERFRSLITNYRDHSYCTSYSASEKKAVALEIIQHIQSLVPAGRFLKRDTRGGQSPRGRDGPWVELGEREAIKKTCQALRDCNRHDRHGYATGLKQPNDVMQQAQQVKDTGMSNKQRASRAAAKQAAVAAAAAQANLKRTREILEQQVRVNPHHIPNSSYLSHHHHMIGANNMTTIAPRPLSSIFQQSPTITSRKKSSHSLVPEDAISLHSSYTLRQSNSIHMANSRNDTSSLSFASPIFHPYEKWSIKKQRTEDTEPLSEESSRMSNSVDLHGNKPSHGSSHKDMHSSLFKSNVVSSQHESHPTETIVLSEPSLMEHDLFKSNVTNTTTTILSKNKLSRKENIHSLHETCIDNFNNIQDSTSNFDQSMLFPPKLHRKHTSSDTLSTSISLPPNLHDELFPKDTIRSTDTQDSKDVGLPVSISSNLDIFKPDYVSPRTNDNPRLEKEEHGIQWPAPTSGIEEVTTSFDEGISAADVKFEGI